jgi:hypothetical protein
LSRLAAEARKAVVLVEGHRLVILTEKDRRFMVRSSQPDRKEQAFHGPLFPAKAISAGLDRDNQRISGNAISTVILGLRAACTPPSRSPDGNRSLAN